MKSLWFFLAFICVASCRYYNEDGSVLEDEKALDFDYFKELDSKFSGEQWDDLELKDSEISPELRKFLFWDFDSIENKELESDQEESENFYLNSNEVGEEKSDVDSPLFLIDEDESKLMNEKPSNFESENSDESAEKYENDDWLYSDYADLLDKFIEQEKKNLPDENAAIEILPLPSFETDEENNGKLSEAKDLLFSSGNSYDYFSDKLSEEKSDIDNSLSKISNMDDIQLPSLTFDQILKMAEDEATKIKDEKLIEEKGTNDWMKFPYVNDYDYFTNKLDKKNMETVNENSNIEITLWTKTKNKNKITIRVVSLDDNDLVGNSEIDDGKKGFDWETFPEGKYIGSYEYPEKGDYDNVALRRRYFGRSSMFMVSTVIVVFSIMIFGFCLLCKIFNSKKKVLKLCNKDSNYQPLNEEVA